MTKFDTGFTRLVGIDIPIVQAPVGGITTPDLVAAVSNAGALGLLSATWREPNTLRELLAETKQLTDRPFGINLVLDWDPTERLEICLEAGVRLITFFWGDPAPYVERIHEAGSLVSHTVGNVEEAKQAIAAGVDLIVAQGVEAGGHVWGKIGTLPLVRAVTEAVAPVPVVAAGGIVDGYGLAAALALGASGVWMGTRFLMSQEAAIHPEYRSRLIDAVETDTIHTEVFDGGWQNAPLRALLNSTYVNWENAGSKEKGFRPGEDDVVGHNELGEPVLRYSSSSPNSGATGDIEAMVMYAGQGVGLVNRVQPAGEIVREVAMEAITALDMARATARQEVVGGRS